jgi:hypothetical protein
MAVCLGGVEEGDAPVYSGPDERDAGGLIDRLAVVGAQAHAAEPDCRDFQAAGTKGVLLKPVAAQHRFMPQHQQFGVSRCLAPGQ